MRFIIFIYLLLLANEQKISQTAETDNEVKCFDRRTKKPIGKTIYLSKQFQILNETPNVSCPAIQTNATSNNGKITKKIEIVCILNNVLGFDIKYSKLFEIITDYDYRIRATFYFTRFDFYRNGSSISSKSNLIDMASSRDLIESYHQIDDINNQKQTHLKTIFNLTRNK